MHARRGSWVLHAVARNNKFIFVQNVNQQNKIHSNHVW